MQSKHRPFLTNLMLICTHVCVGVTFSATVFANSALASTPAFDHCFDQTGHQSGIEPRLLRSIAIVESSMQPSAINGSHQKETNSQDLGLMQINSSWLPKLQQFGIERHDLFKPCTSIEVGAWVLSYLFQRFGNSWEAVGAYNAACTKLKGQDCRRARDTYIAKVQKAYARLAAKDNAKRPADLQRAQASSLSTPSSRPASRHVMLDFETSPPASRHELAVAALTHDTFDTLTQEEK